MAKPKLQKFPVFTAPEEPLFTDKQVMELIRKRDSGMSIQNISYTSGIKGGDISRATAKLSMHIAAEEFDALLVLTAVDGSKTVGEFIRKAVNTHIQKNKLLNKKLPSERQLQLIRAKISKR